MPDDAVYKPLSRDSGFRIIEMQASTNLSGPICGRLVYADLKSYPPFEALSYVWGTSLGSESILVNGDTLDIMISLAEALRHLRLPDRVRFIWAGAICINQHNLDEKINHASYMSQVYRRCTRDLLWLGENAGVLQHAETAMNYFSTISAMVEEDWSIIGGEPEQSAWDNLEDMQNKLKDLFAWSSVWKRVWIVQEPAHAPSTQLVAGNAILSWNAVEDFLQPNQYIERYGVPDAFHGPFSHEWSMRTWAGGAIAFPQIMCCQRRVIQNSEKIDGASMLDVLSRIRYTNSTDPRDKIYALLSLVTDSISITVDYKLPTRAVYTDCMKKLINHEGNFDVLVQSPWEIDGNKDRSKDLPSWVTDFAELATLTSCLLNDPSSMLEELSLPCR